MVICIFIATLSVTNFKALAPAVSSKLGVIRIIYKEKFIIFSLDPVKIASMRHFIAMMHLFTIILNIVPIQICLDVLCVNDSKKFNCS